MEGAPQARSPAAPQQGNSQPSQPQAPEERNEPSPFIFFDAWILAGVALLAFAVVFAKFVYNRLRQSRDPAGDGLGVLVRRQRRLTIGDFGCPL